MIWEHIYCILLAIKQSILEKKVIPKVQYFWTQRFHMKLWLDIMEDLFLNISAI